MADARLWQLKNRLDFENFPALDKNGQAVTRRLSHPGHRLACCLIAWLHKTSSDTESFELSAARAGSYIGFSARRGADRIKELRTAGIIQIIGRENHYGTNSYRIPFNVLFPSVTKTQDAGVRCSPKSQGAGVRRPPDASVPVHISNSLREESKKKKEESAAQGAGELTGKVEAASPRELMTAEERLERFQAAKKLAGLN